MRKSKLKTNYEHLHDDEVVPFAEDVVHDTTASSYFPDGTALAKPVLDAVTVLKTAMALTTHPSPQQNAERDELRAQVKAALGKLAGTINLDFAGNEAALLSSGLELVEAPGTRRPAPEAVTVTLTDAAQRGGLRVRSTRPRGMTVTIVRYTTDPTLPEENWLVAFGHDIVLGLFPSGTRVAVKVAALSGSTREPVYSAVVWRIVQ